MKLTTGRFGFRVAESAVSGDKVVFVFTALGFKIGHYRLFIKLLNRRGYTVVIYDYPIRIAFNAKFDEWEGLYVAMAKDAHSRVTHFKKSGFTHFYAYGVSVGTLMANRLTRDTPEITHLILNLTYGDLAGHIMESPATRKTRQTMAKKEYRR